MTLNELITELTNASTDRAVAATHFTRLFNEGVTKLDKNTQEKLGRLFDASKPTVARWKNGTTVPAVARTVLSILRDRLVEERTVERDFTDNPS